MDDYQDVPSLNPDVHAYQPIVSCCLNLLYLYPAGTDIYILSCLCPEVVAVVLELVCLDLDVPHHHKRLLQNELRIRLNSYEDLLSRFRAYTSKVPAKDYCCFWLELTRNWLLTCPFDSSRYHIDEAGEDLFCKELRTELVESILRID